MKKVVANYKQGEAYYYVSRATLACSFLCGGKILNGKPIALHLKRPAPSGEFHRVTLTVVRTKAEAKALNAKYANLRAKRRAEVKREAFSQLNANAP